MINNLQKFNSIICEIEDKLTDVIDITALAQSIGLSVYEFRRIFSFAAGVPISEYIRKRRLSAAAEELLTEKYTISETALRYGYDSPSSFSRAFKEFHGFSPKELSKSSNHINMFTKISFDLTMNGGTDIQYKIIKDEKFSVHGFTAQSEITDTECCESVWNDFYNSENCEKILDRCGDELYSVYVNNGNSVVCCIGARTDKHGDIDIPASSWACFRLTGTDDTKTNEFYRNILFRWLESGRYERNPDAPNIEIFPADMSDDDFEWEIRIPIKEK